MRYKCESELISHYVYDLSALNICDDTVNIPDDYIVFVSRKLVMFLYSLKIVDRGSETYDNDIPYEASERCGLFVCSSSSMKTGTQIHVNLVVNRERDEVLTLYHTRRVYSSSRDSCTRRTYFG